MYLIAGSNLFGQWCLKECLLEEFTACDKFGSDPDKDFFKLIQISWAYNIYQSNDSFYMSGSWGGEEGQSIEISPPVECVKFGKDNIIVIGNDHKLFFANKLLNKIWIQDIEDCKNVKQINFNETCFSSDPKRKKEEFKLQKVVAKNTSLLCLTEDSKVYEGMLPSLVDTCHCIGNVCDIQSGYEHFLLLTDAGRVYTWGNGRRLQLGHGGLDNLETPTEVEALAGIKIVKIRAGGWHSMALSEFGDLYVWGWNDTGQLGIKSPTNNPSCLDGLSSCPLPSLVDLYIDEEEVSLNIKDIGCGSRHSVIVLEDNSIWTTGCNKYGALGFPTSSLQENYFKRAYKCNTNVEVLCGPWTTVLCNMQ